MLRDVTTHARDGRHCPSCGQRAGGHGGRLARRWRILRYAGAAAQIGMIAIIGLLSIVGAITLLLAIEVRGVVSGSGQVGLWLETEPQVVMP
ncbi:hypothetical protein [Sphingobium baderi]|uniref:hypothetical protein n=1 Tax=Sphingobium baderi TaxID=1332080 RepID=UPI002B40F799|nr:hypothetical protein [Sphingobium baderi]WRD78825.1 hypothetical protein QQ987_19285 [Sphingobium baderi]